MGRSSYDITQDEIEREYLAKDVSLEVAGQALGCSAKVLRTAIQRYGLKAKPPGKLGAGRPGRYLQLRDKVWLEAQLQVKTVAEIAQELSMSVANIRDHIKRRGITYQPIKRDSSVDMEVLRSLVWAMIDQQACLGTICGCHKGIDHCWPWLGKTLPKGYGWIATGGKKLLIHRLVLEWEVGPLGKKMACHRCDNEICGRPSHLFPGTQLENMRDASQKGRIQKGDLHWRRRISASRTHH